MSTARSFQYRLQIRRESDGAWFPTEPVADAYVQECRELAIFQSQRRGVTGPDPSEAVLHEEPNFAGGGDGLISGITITVGNGDGQIRKQFSLELFGPAARAEARRLVQAGQLPDGSQFQFRVIAERLGQPAHAAGRSDGVVVKVRRAPLPFVEGRLDDWLASAQPVGPTSDDDYPLLITEQALELSREYSRRPGDKEGGAMLLGHLFRQLQPRPEIFGVIDAVLEALHAKHEAFSLELSAETFAGFNAQLALRRTRLGRRNELFLAFAHSHGFLPSALDGKPKCADCPLRPTCTLTSSFYSAQDELFHRALFGGRAPFAVGLVWGLTPRETDDLRVFCLDVGGARERGYHRIGKPIDVNV